jgi:prepilin-type processing-associated H-X9-DG protein
MNRLRSRALLTLFAIGVVAGATVAFWQPGSGPEPGTLLPADAVLFVKVDGTTTHQDAWRATAAYEALQNSGLEELGQRIEETVREIMAREGGGMPPELEQAVVHIGQNGFSLAATLGEGQPAPWGVIVLHNATSFEEAATDLLSQVSQGELEFTTDEIQGRSVTHTMIPNSPVQLGIWSEETHLCVAVGINAVESALAVASGDAPNLTSSPQWERYVTADLGFEVTTTGWINFAPAREMFGEMPVPLPEGGRQVTVMQILETLGLQNLDAVVGISGYKRRSLWSETYVEAPAPRTGLLSLMDAEPISLADLPPLPYGMDGFSASSMDASKLYDVLVEIAHNVEALGPPDAAGSVDRGLALVEETLGFDLKSGVFDHLGNVACIYGDQRQSFGLGVGLVLQVKDGAALQKSLESMLALVQQEANGEFVVRHVEKHGHEMTLLEVARGVFNPTFAIEGEWMCIGLMPQTVEAFQLRTDGELTVWEPSEAYAEGFAELPTEFTSVSSLDPRKTYSALAGIAPILYSGMVGYLRAEGAVPQQFELPITAADLPCAEYVSQPLYPNISVTVVDDNGMRQVSRSSAPAIPILGEISGGSGIAAVAIGAALLLPAIQQAREAARRAQSMNNLRQIGLAMHNYADVNQNFPQGTVPNEKLDPEERLSWIASVLPYLDQSQLYQNINFDEAWDDEDNEISMQSALPTLINPSSPEGPVNADFYGVTHYVGVAGLGEDGPTLDVDEAGAGVFAYDRVTEFADIFDGTSNTICVGEAMNVGPWGQGGVSSIRPLTEAPYINGPDGFGGYHAGGSIFLFCDGSTRFISENIDSSIMEALTTIRGGEVIGAF